jgi:hypothetical protein
MASSSSFMLALSMGRRELSVAFGAILGLFAAALILGVAFIVRLRTAPEPLIPLSILNDREVRLSVAVNAFGWAPIVGLHIFLPIYLQNIVGMAPASAGLSVLTLAVTLNISAGITGTILPSASTTSAFRSSAGARDCRGAGAGVARAEHVAVEFEVLLFLIGCGFGCMPPLAATALQNNVSIHTFGSASPPCSSRATCSPPCWSRCSARSCCGMAAGAQRAASIRSTASSRLPRGRRELRDRARPCCCWTKSRSQTARLGPTPLFCAILSRRETAPQDGARAARRNAMACNALLLSPCVALLRSAPRQPRAVEISRSAGQGRVGFAAGGGTDVAARVIAQKLSEATGQAFVVENRPGASGLIASEQVAKSPRRRLHHHGRQPDHARGRARALQEFQLDAAKDFTASR